MPSLDQRPHLGEEEGHQQRGDMGAIDIGVGHDDHPLVTQVIHGEPAPGLHAVGLHDAAAERRCGADLDRLRKATSAPVFAHELEDFADADLRFHSSFYIVAGHRRLEAIWDFETSDLFTEITRAIDKWLWFVEANTQASE